MRLDKRSLLAVLVVSVPGSLFAIVGCAKDKSAAPAASSVALPPGAAAVPSAPGRAAAAPTCVVGSEKVWAANASVAAGISETELDASRVAFGVVLGGRPEVLVFNAKGEGEEKHVGLKKALTDPIAKGAGRREIHRVTPAVGAGGEVLAFVDFDQVGKDHRTVACGPSDSTNELLKFDGKPLVSVAEDRLEGAVTGVEKKPGASEAPAPAKAAPAPAKAAAAPPPPLAPPAPARAATALEPPHQRAIHTAAARPGDLARLAEKTHEALAVARAVTAPPSAAPAPPPAKPAEASKPKGDKVRELRDCRTLVDRGGAHAWSLGSELVGQPQQDGSTEWSMDFFAEQELGRGKVTLTASPLGKAPTKLPEYESPVALDLGNGEFALTTRYRGTLFAWLLDATKHPRGPMRLFSGILPGAPRFASFGVDRSLLVVAHEAGDRAVPRSLGFDPAATQLPATLTDLSLGGLPLVGPMSGAQLGTQRFVLVQSDETARRLSLLPVDAVLASLGNPILVDAGVLESRLVPIPDGRLLLVYLRSGQSGRVELVSRTVKC